jgi:hypothetical protein
MVNHLALFLGHVVSRSARAVDVRQASSVDARAAKPPEGGLGS